MTHSIQHHLTDALLMAYSAGTLPEAFNLTVATHIAMCDECRARMGAFDSVGGALMDAGASQAMAPGSMAAALAKARSAPRAPQPMVNRSNVPTPLQGYIGTDLNAINWRPVGMGVKQAILPTDKGATARLLYIPAGVAVPDHGHRGTELTLVLQGAFFDQTDRFAAGDIEVAGEELDHTPTAEMGADCICLAATDAPLRFRSLIPRLAQPFLRI
jgi:putative transcriptional regulator